MKPNRKPFFSNKGNPGDYDYLGYQVKFIALAAIFVVIIVLLVEAGVLG